MTRANKQKLKEKRYFYYFFALFAYTKGVAAASFLQLWAAEAGFFKNSSVQNFTIIITT